MALSQEQLAALWLEEVERDRREWLAWQRAAVKRAGERWWRAYCGWPPKEG